MSKHHFTPGPWMPDIEPQKRFNGRFQSQIYRFKAECIAIVIGDNKTVVDANATLMAAVPELLEALRSARALLSALGVTEESRIGGEQMKHINESIKKATCQ